MAKRNTLTPATGAAQTAKLNKLAIGAALIKVAPALDTRDIIEELTCLWFDGTKVRAFNSQIGLETDLPSPVRGGLRGKILVGLFNNSAAKECEFETAEGGLVWKAAGTKVNLSLMPPEREVAWPATPAGTPVKITPEFLRCLKTCMLSIGSDTSAPDQLGITIKRRKEELNFYTTDRLTISWMYCEAPAGWEADRITLPTAFCEQLIRLGRDGDTLVMDEAHVVAQLGDTTKLLGALVAIERPLNYAKEIQEMLPADLDDIVFPIPAGLAESLERAKTLITANGNDTVTLEADGLGNIVVSTAATLGKMTDHLKVDIQLKPITVKFDPKLVGRALSQCAEMAITENVIVLFSAQGLAHLISNR